MPGNTGSFLWHLLSHKTEASPSSQETITIHLCYMDFIMPVICTVCLRLQYPRFEAFDQRNNYCANMCSNMGLYQWTNTLHISCVFSLVSVTSSLVLLRICQSSAETTRAQYSVGRQRHSLQKTQAYGNSTRYANYLSLSLLESFHPGKCCSDFWSTVFPLFQCPAGSRASAFYSFSFKSLDLPVFARELLEYLERIVFKLVYGDQENVQATVGSSFPCSIGHARVLCSSSELVL